MDIYDDSHRDAMFYFCQDNEQEYLSSAREITTYMKIPCSIFARAGKMNISTF